MELSVEQIRALDDIGRWMATDKPLYRLFAPAGCGKTTIAQYIAQGHKTCFCAPTGKAAKVLREKGCPASTIHSLIYRPKAKSQMRLLDLQGRRDAVLAANPEAKVADLDRQIAEEKRNLARPAFSLNLDSEIRQSELCIIDEVSMVDARVAEDLLSFGVKLLVLGDPHQLPPVAGLGFFINAEPDFLLTQIHRQAAESPIIRLATAIREGRRIIPGEWGDMVVKKGSISPEAALTYDQIIVGRNKTRKATNARVRTLKGFTDPLPVAGDRVICLRNNRELGLYNGAIWFVTDRFGKDDIVDLSIRGDDEDSQMTVPAWSHHFTDPVFEPTQMSFWEKKDAEDFDYGYSCTAHKGQGSEWDSVLVFDESDCFGKDAAKHRYTAVTRAAEKLTLVV